MVSGRPLLYLSLPGVAFILGVFWFRRRNKNRIESGGETAKVDARVDNKEATATATAIIKSKNATNESCIRKNSNTANTSNANSIGSGGGEEQTKHYSSATASKPMNINGSISTDDISTPTKVFGKSAPIKIQSNGRCSPASVSGVGKAGTATQQQTQIDSEILKTKIQDADYKTLRSIDEDFENLSSPVDLPDSITNRVSFYSRNASCKNDEPIVIKATRTPKISPENSFLESKYTKECEQNNNCELNDDNAVSATTTATKLDNEVNKLNRQQQQQQQQHQQQLKQYPQCSHGVDDELLLTTNKLESDVANAADNNVVDANGNDDKQQRNVASTSPSLSLCSVQSGDSGKGSSLPRSEATRAKTTFEFFFPNSLIGQLYGRKRGFINQVKSKTSANIVLSKNRYSGKVRICTIEGSESEVNAALAMIRQRLPVKRYPNFSMQRIHFAQPQTIVPLSTESLLNLQLKLIEGINNDIVVSAVVSGGHIFVQQPLHPTHPSLAVLQKCLYDNYSTTEAPMLPGIEISAVCVMAVNGIWYRVQIIEQDCEDEKRCIVKFLDFGGYMNVHFNDLRQIRSDFMCVPFQATECILSNIEPTESSWSADSTDILCKLTKDIVLQAQVAGYNNHNIPEIYLFAYLGPNNVIFINKELVARNLARWVEVRE